MQRLRFTRILAILFGFLTCSVANATMVQQMNLGELTLNADKIFRGTVIRIESGSITAGGAELSTVKYVFRVSDTLKGDTSSPNGKAGNVVEVTMLGTLKPRTSESGARFVGAFQPPKLKSGEEYLLFTTRPSSIGLSMTVGVGQGAFRFVGGDNVINDAKNAGLFRDMQQMSLPAKGPIPYSDFKREVRDLIQRGGN